MAVAQAFGPVELPTQAVWYGQLLVPPDSERIVISDGVRKSVYVGDFSYGPLGEVSGTLLSFEEYLDGELLYTIDEIGVSASEIYTAVQILGDLQLSASIVFGGEDTLTGSSGSDYVRSFGGDDTIDGAGGNDTLDGGDGIDTAVFGGTSGNYILSIDGAGSSIDISDKRSNGTGDDLLESIELLQFSDGFSFGDNGVFDLTQITGAVGLSEDMLFTFVEMYVAYFDRAPDSLGLLYWSTRLADGMGLGEIAQSFFFQEETFALYPELEGMMGVDDPSSLPTSFYETLVTDTYNKLLERDSDAAGRDYWIGELQSGNVRLGEFVLAVINGAKDFDPTNATPEQIAQAEADVQTVAEKGQLGYAFAVENGMNDVDNARDVMGTYDIADRAGTISAAETLIAEYRAAAEAADSSEILVQITNLGEDPLAFA